MKKSQLIELEKVYPSDQSNNKDGMYSIYKDKDFLYKWYHKNNSYQKKDIHDDNSEFSSETDFEKE